MCVHTHVGAANLSPCPRVIEEESPAACAADVDVSSAHLRTRGAVVS